jgi:hypothetical protein
MVLEKSPTHMRVRTSWRRVQRAHLDPATRKARRRVISMSAAKVSLLFGVSAEHQGQGIWILRGSEDALERVVAWMSISPMLEFRRRLAGEAFLGG